MHAWIASADDVLRQARWVVRAADSRRAWLQMVSYLVVFGLIYGAAMGSFRGLAGEPQWIRQMIYSAVKVPLLLSVTFLISLPSFYVLNALLGLGNDFAQAVRALVAAQAGLAIILASLAPFTLLWYASSDNYSNALFFNGIMFAVASFCAQWLVRGYYRPLLARHPHHRKLLWCWIGVYTAVAIQMAWLLRPFIGSPGFEVQFIRPEAWDNAYVIVARLVWQTLFL